MTAVSIHPTPTVLTAATAAALWEGGAGDSEAGWTCLADEVVDSGRWLEHRRLVVSNGAGAFGVDYSNGLTEMQDNEWPWQHVPDDKPMDLVPLVVVQVTTTRYLTDRQYEAYLKKGTGQ